MRLQDLFGPRADLVGMTRRLKRMMDIEGLPFDEGRDVTYNSRLAQELAKWGETTEASEQLNMALYQAYFAKGKNIGDAAVLLDVVAQVGLPAEAAREVLVSRSMRAAVDADWQYARSVGVSSVPTFAVGMTGVVGAQPYEVLMDFLEHVGVPKREV